MGNLSLPLVKTLCNQGYIKTPKWLPEAIQFEGFMGSMAYGTATPQSDIDIYGWCIPPKELIFEHLQGIIRGFGKQGERFDQFLSSFILEGEKEYDITIYNIVKYFHLLLNNNPNILDSLFIPSECITFITPIGQMVRGKREIFLSKRTCITFFGYAQSQWKKIISKNPIGKRKEIVEKWGYDIKFASHLVRLLLELEYVLRYGEMDLRWHSGLFRSVKMGEWSFEELTKWFNNQKEKLKILEEKSSLREKPDEQAIKNLLLECLEEYYGSLEGCIKR